MRVFKEIEVADLTAMLEENTTDIHIVDIRNLLETRGGIIPGAERLPMSQLPFNLEKFKLEQHIFVLYCQLGVRSTQACAFLSVNGYDNVHSLRGGIQAWTRSGLRVA